MKLRAIILENFRSYRDRTFIPIDDFTAIIGKNDKGKSTALEALEVFFNNKTVKIGRDDGCVYENGDPKNVRIGCIFDDISEPIVLDSDCETTLEAEELLNADGLLEIHKVYDCTASKINAKVYCQVHAKPTATGDSLLSMTIAKLKAAYKGLKDPEEANQTMNPELRRAIRNANGAEAVAAELSMSEGNCKEILKAINAKLPAFALFQSDRKSTDQDKEAQDPLNAAVDHALKEVETMLSDVRKEVIGKVTKVAKATIKKLEDMDERLAEQLVPLIDEDPAWSKAFSVELQTSNGIPLNKRGSGVRRLVLLNFFRAQAEEDASNRNVIYAVEEPESAQHTHNQRLILNAFQSLTARGQAQVLITTHSSNLAGMLPKEVLRLVDQDENDCAFVRYSDPNDSESCENLLKEIADNLGVTPDNRTQVFFYVEGKNDVNFFKHLSATLSEQHEDVPNLIDDPRVAFVPVGGSTLKEWIQEHYFEELNRPEFHLYDGDQAEQRNINVDELREKLEGRGDGSQLILLQRKAAENYFLADAIERVTTHSITVEHHKCVPTALVQAENAAKGKPPETKVTGYRKSHWKRVLNTDVAEQMSNEEWNQSDPDSELLGILKNLNGMLS